MIAVPADPRLSSFSATSSGEDWKEFWLQPGAGLKLFPQPPAEKLQQFSPAWPGWNAAFLHSSQCVPLFRMKINLIGMLGVSKLYISLHSNSIRVLTTP
jgi:hypothetical protein